ncbi:hypothetical protein GCM10010969_26830 [Saccharibacillus kuerlensis]|uniref:Uncharacterized protein n=2 Tax=Saccharibacillus kuerlensis TaxID=459527 RepID=A0ABQ2L4J6_9BACL|nr:hypothetical protein GCM10010969_26830 [Saccharibacillus kuerlensis]
MNLMGLLYPVVIAVITYVIYYFVIKLAINHSNMTREIYSLRMDLNELERRQAERFERMDAHYEAQNTLLREQNEILLRQNRRTE